MFKWVFIKVILYFRGPHDFIKANTLIRLAVLFRRSLRTGRKLSERTYLTVTTNPKELPRWLSGKESAYQCRRRRFDPWIGKIPWRRKLYPTPVFLPGQSHGQRSLAGYSPWGREESDTTEWTQAHGRQFGLWASSHSLTLWPPAVLRYSWHVTLCKFKMHSVLIGYTNTLWNDYHPELANISTPSYKYHFVGLLIISKSLWEIIFRTNAGNTRT